MPNCDFYAAGSDFGDVLEYVFTRSECQVFETYSPIGDELAEFTSFEQIAARYPVGTTRHTAPSVLLSLVVPGGLKFHCCRTMSWKDRPPSLVRYTRSRPSTVVRMWLEASGTTNAVSGSAASTASA